MGLREMIEKRMVHMALEGHSETPPPKVQAREFALFSAILAGFFIFAYRGFFGLGVLNQGDLLPSYPNWGDYLNAFVSSWSNSNLGFSGSATEAGFFNALILLAFGNNTLLVQKVLFLVTMPTACLAMFIFLGSYLTLGFEKLVISFIYGVNPVTIGLFFGGGVGLLTYYSIFPLLLLFLFNFLEGRKGSSVSIVEFGIVLAYAAAIDVQASLFILPFALAFLISQLMTATSHLKGLRMGASLFASFLTFAILTLPTTSAYFSSLFGYFSGSAQGTIIHYSATPISRDILISRIRDDFAFQTYDFLAGSIIITSIMMVLVVFVSNAQRLRHVLTVLSLLVVGIVFWQLGINGSDMWLYNTFPLLFALSTLKLKMLFVQAFVLLGALFLEEARSRRLFVTDVSFHHSKNREYVDRE